MTTIRIIRTSANTCNLLVNGNIFRQYWAPAGGGDVRAVTFRDFGIYGKQVGYDLAGSGDMMHAPAGTDLTTMIRAAVKTKAGRENVLMQAGIV
jgi:hypothetical protein